MPELRRLVVNADDFGLSDGINRGILEAFAAGALASTSMMVTMPAFASAAREARAMRAGLGVGLHLTLTVGRPLTRARSLIDPAGAFLSRGRLLARALSGGVREADVAEECAAQVARLRAEGLGITHLDAHHHAHVFPTIRDAVRAVARAEGIPVVRRPVESLARAPLPWRRLPTRALLATLCRRGKRFSVGEPPAAPIAFAGHTLLGAPSFASALLRLLDALPPGTTELMVHPGYADDPLPGGDRHRREREIELRALTSPAVLRRLQAPDIQLLHFGALAAVRGATPPRSPPPASGPPR